MFKLSLSLGTVCVTRVSRQLESELSRLGRSARDRRRYMHVEGQITELAKVRSTR